MDSLTPEQLFFRYAWPCAETMRSKGNITDRQYRALKEYRDNPHLLPLQDILEICFPRACVALRLLGNETRREAWDIDNVAEYWRMYHAGSTPVRVYRVEEVRCDGTILATQPPVPIELLNNPYSLDLRKGDQVYAHVNCAIEQYWGQ